MKKFKKNEKNLGTFFGFLKNLTKKKKKKKNFNRFRKKNYFFRSEKTFSRRFFLRSFFLYFFYSEKKVIFFKMSLSLDFQDEDDIFSLHEQYISPECEVEASPSLEQAPIDVPLAIVPTAGGNTVPAQVPAPGPLAPSPPSGKVKRWNPAKFLCGTAYPEDGESIEELGDKIRKAVDKHVVKYAAQVEKCPSTGRLHIQFALEAKSKIRPTAFNLSKRIHWEICKGSWADNFAYVTKEETREGKAWFKGCSPQREVRILKPEQLKPWMKNYLELFETEADGRSVHWAWSAEGGVGKTSFAK